MSSDHISRRNHANAQKSTGPRTSKGKAKVSRNARKHGATAQPDPESIATWLAIILDRPEIIAQDLMPADDLGYRALALAQAEARLVAAENGLRELEQHYASVSPREELEPADFFAGVFGPKAHERHKDDRTGAVLMSMYPIMLSQMAEQRRGRRRLLKRYLSEAKSRRRKAFAAWLEIRQREVAPA
jgi:hypothetical protein